MLGWDPGLAALKTVLVERTDGNPLFLEESVRALVETQALIGEPGARRLAKPLETVEVPGSVQAVLAARIDRLTPAAKHVLQSASVIGKDVPFPVLAGIADLPDEGLRAGLGLLQSGELLYEVSFFPEIEYTFKHALTHAVAYRSLLHETRRALHARIVDVIERLYAGRLGEHVERLAHHALRGGLRDRAVAYLRQEWPRPGRHHPSRGRGAACERAADPQPAGAAPGLARRGLSPRGPRRRRGRRRAVPTWRHLPEPGPLDRVTAWTARRGPTSTPLWRAVGWRSGRAPSRRRTCGEIFDER
ncbi:MAG: hypothetical protein ACREKJ_16265 [Candidatus Rokuibacteriota bacterium]